MRLKLIHRHVKCYANGLLPANNKLRYKTLRSLPRAIRLFCEMSTLHLIRDSFNIDMQTFNKLHWLFVQPALTTSGQQTRRKIYKMQFYCASGWFIMMTGSMVHKILLPSCSGFQMDSAHQVQNCQRKQVRSLFSLLIRQRKWWTRLWSRTEWVSASLCFSQGLL